MAENVPKAIERHSIPNSFNRMINNESAQE